MQTLRGIAASLVVFHHFARLYRDGIPRHSWIYDSGLGDLAKCGVDIFFVISGFIMVYTTKRKTGTSDSLIFMKRRALRIYPLYWIWTTVLLALWLVGFVLRQDHYSALYLLRCYLLIPTWNGTELHLLLGQAWTLSFEILFYIIFSAGIMLGLRSGKLIFVAASFIILGLLSRFFAPGGGIRFLFSNPIVIEFLYGMIAAEVILQLPSIHSLRVARILPLALMALGATALLLTVRLSNAAEHRFLFYGIPALFMVFGAVMQGSAPAPRLLVYLGDASYSVYLAQGFLVSAYATALAHRLAVQKFVPDLVVVVAGMITIALSSLTYPLIERPMTKVLSEGWKSKHASPRTS